MRYGPARAQIRSGDLIAWTHRAWASWYDLQVQAVRVFTRSEYCHVGIAWVVAGRVFVIEAVTPRVRIFPLSRLLPFWLVTTRAPWRPVAEEFALAQVGQPYSKWQAIKSYFGRPDADQLWQCAELARAILLQDGIDLGEQVTPSAIVYSAQQRDEAITTLVTS